MIVTLAVEGVLDEAVLRRLCDDQDHLIAAVHNTRGKARMDVQLPAFNNAARHAVWIALRDLDHDAACAMALRRRLIPNESIGMRFRVPVRAIEAWLLADRKGMADFFSVALAHVPEAPEGLHDPKQALVNVARQSRSRAIRTGILPRDRTTAKVGPAYTALLQEFVSDTWDYVGACLVSDSLRRCVDIVRTLTAHELP